MGGNEHKHTQLNCYAAVLIYGVERLPRYFLLVQRASGMLISLYCYY